MNRSKFNITYSFVNEDDIIVLDDETGKPCTYRFREPIESNRHSGYYAIPNFSRYLLSKDGVLLSLLSDTPLGWCNSKHSGTNITGGYKVTNIVNDFGRRVGVSRHRLLMLVFTKYDFHPSSMWVNHINGIPGDDRLDNLEWVTPGENVKHAYDNGLHPNKIVAIDALNWVTGQTLRFPSIAKASEQLNINFNTICTKLMRGNERRYPDGWRFKRSDEDWLALNDRTRMSDMETEVISRNIFTGEVNIYPSMILAANHTKVKPGTIQRQCTDKVLTPFDGWNFRYVNDHATLPIYTEKHLVLFRKMSDNNYSDGITIYRDNKEIFFGTAKEVAAAWNISPITALKLARDGKIRQGYRFEIFKINKSKVSGGPI